MTKTKKGSTQDQASLGSLLISDLSAVRGVSSWEEGLYLEAEGLQEETGIIQKGRFPTQIPSGRFVQARLHSLDLYQGGFTMDN